MDYFIDFAAYEPKDLYLKGHGLVHLERGEWAFTQRELAEFLCVGRQQIRDNIELLIGMNFLTQDTTQSRTQHITKVNIINYDTYQSEEPNLNPTKNPTKNPTPTQLDNPTIYTKNKRIKEKDMVARRRQIPPDFILSEKLLQFAKEHGINGNRINDVLEHFKEHHQSRGTTMLDWDKAFMTWVRNDKKFGSKNNFEKKRPPADLLKWGSSDSTG